MGRGVRPIIFHRTHCWHEYLQVYYRARVFVVLFPGGRRIEEVTAARQRRQLTADD